MIVYLVEASDWDYNEVVGIFLDVKQAELFLQHSDSDKYYITPTEVEDDSFYKDEMWYSIVYYTCEANPALLRYSYPKPKLSLLEDQNILEPSEVGESFFGYYNWIVSKVTKTFKASSYKEAASIV